MLTVSEAHKRLRELSVHWRKHGDDEHAHSLEDALRNDVLKAIADGSPDSRRLAVIALKTSALGFARWCA